VKAYEFMSEAKLREILNQSLEFATDADSYRFRTVKWYHGRATTGDSGRLPIVPQNKRFDGVICERMNL
jgi:hypothetical protein